jgi:hypothetical protein
MRRFRVEQSLTLEAPGGRIEAWVAQSFRARLVGLAGLAAVEPGRGLVIPGCRSVHTLAMRFPIDVAFLAWPPAPRSAVLALHEAVGPMRVLRVGGVAARSVAALEAPAGTLSALGLRGGAPVLLPVGERLLTSGRERHRADRGLAGPP